MRFAGMLMSNLGMFPRICGITLFMLIRCGAVRFGRFVVVFCSFAMFVFWHCYSAYIGALQGPLQDV